MTQAVVRRYYGQQPGYAASIAGGPPWVYLGDSRLLYTCVSELADPQKLLPYILQPEITNLSPDIIAVYILAATKIFGFWATEVAERWSEDDLPEVRNLVDDIVTRVTEFAGSPQIEVQERVSQIIKLTFFSSLNHFIQAANTLQLFYFIRADLNAHRPKPDSPFGDQSSSFDPIAEPRFPKSLYLIRPLFSSYNLNPVALAAQASVPIPDGLDLDAWIVPPPPDPTSATDVELKVKRNKKGKDKDVNGAKVVKNGKKKRKQDEDDSASIHLSAGTPEIETADELAQRERVRFCLAACLFQISDVIAHSGRRKDWNDCATIHTILWMGLPLSRLRTTLTQYRWYGWKTCPH